MSAETMTPPEVLGLAPVLTARSLLLQAGFGDERRQALGFAWAVDPALARAYEGDPAGLAAARARQLAPFNAHPYAAGVPLGAAAALEARAAAGDASAPERAAALKTALGAGLAGPADAFFWGSLRPLAAALAVLVAAAGARLRMPHALAWGAAAGLLAFNVPAWLTRSRGVRLGLERGEQAAADACTLPCQEWIRRARWAAVLMILLACAACAGVPQEPALVIVAAAFAAGAALAAPLGGPLKLVGAAAVLGMLASAAGWMQ